MPFVRVGHAHCLSHAEAGQRTITLKNAVSFTDDRGNATMLGATASVVSHEVAPF